MKIIDYYASQDDVVMLRMAVAGDRIVGCEGPLAFVVEGLNDILDGELDPDDAANMLGFDGGVEHGLATCPPLSSVTAQLGDLLRDPHLLTVQPQPRSTDRFSGVSGVTALHGDGSASTVVRAVGVL